MWLAESLDRAFLELIMEKEERLLEAARYTNKISNKSSSRDRAVATLHNKYQSNRWRLVRLKIE